MLAARDAGLRSAGLGSLPARPRVLRLAGGRAGGVRARDPGAVPVAGRARLRGHPVPGAGGGRGGARGAPAAARGRRCWSCSALAGLLRPEAWLLGARLLALPVAGARRGRRAGAARGAGRRRAAALGDRATWPSPATRSTPSPSRATRPRRSAGRSGIENVPEIMPRRLGEILRWVPLLGGTAGFFLALRFARERALVPAALAVLGGLALRGDRDRRPVAARAATCSCPRRCCAIFFGFAALGWIGRPLDGPLARCWLGGAAVLLVAFVGLDRLPPDRPARPPARRHPAARRDPGRPARPDARRRAPRPLLERCDPVYVPNHRPVPILAWYLDRDAGRVRLGAARARRAAASTSRPRTDVVEEKFVLDPRDPKRVRGAAPAGRLHGPWPRTSRGCCTSAAC